MPGPDPSWSFVGSGDFLSDGKDQFLVENPTTGLVEIGEIAGDQLTLLYPAQVGLTVVGIGDYFGEHHDQILFAGADGALYRGDYIGGQFQLTHILQFTLPSDWHFH